MFNLTNWPILMPSTPQGEWGGINMNMYRRLLFGFCSIGLMLTTPVAQAGNFVDVLTRPGKIILKEGRRLLNPVAPHKKTTKRKVANAVAKKPIVRPAKVAAPKVRSAPATVANVALAKPEARVEAKEVAFINHYEVGTIVINATTGVLYFVDSSATARRYSVFFGKDVRELHGEAMVTSKAKWPDWVPGLDLLRSDPQVYANPIVIHGITNLEPLKTSASDFGIRMKNELVIDLFERVSNDALVVIL
jgi:lipoprotein-anchoring transpeptidase ErfK/SrfK